MGRLTSGGLALRRRVTSLVVVAALAMAGLGAIVMAPSATAADPCSTGNAIACENSKTGNPQSEWDVQGSGDDTIQGFATTTSIQPGSTVKFKIKASAGYSVDIYRLGYYGGLGARRQAPTWSVSNPVQQGPCATDAFTQNYDCGTWSVSTQWTVPSTAVSGVYIAKLSLASGDTSHITFVVRDDGSTSDVIFKTSDATWQAYNQYGAADFYTAPSGRTETQARAFKVSYNRPIATRGANAGRDFLFSNEYPTLRFLERNGVDVSYTTDVDVTMGNGTLTNHKAFLSVGHDEYWTLPERQRVEAARDAGVNMLFLSGNEVYWHTRMEASIDGSATPYRTLICYKDTWESSHLDPVAEGSPTWRDPMFAAPNGNNPENSLTGQMYMSNNTDLAITVSAQEGKSRLWRGTSLATLAAGSLAALAPHTVGYESDEDVDNGHRPPGLMRLSTTTGSTPQKVQNAGGNVVAPGTTTHSLTLYRAASGALVFGAGTINWGWGLDQNHDGDNSNAADSRMQQATLNMLSDMGVQPTTLMTGMVMPVKSNDTTAPTVAVTSPTSGAALQNGATVTVTGTASDANIVSTVEVSLDGGTTYHRAVGTTSWTYTGVLSGTGASSIKVRASDDSANLSTPVSVPVTVACPCSLFGNAVPATPSSTDASAVELGVSFTADADGFVSAIRFYKGTGNTGTHTGTLWNAAGQVMATGAFTNETASGWQTLQLGAAVPVSAGTRYVASYFAPNGGYAADSSFFSGSDWRAAPLTAPGKPSGVANGVFNGGHGFPATSFGDTNYYVDVLYTRDDTTPPTVTTLSPVPNSSSVATTANPTATFAGTIDASTLAMTMTDANNASVAGTTTFDAPSRTAKFAPSAALTHGSKYSVSVFAKSGAGVPMSAPANWSFTVSLTDPVPGVCPCSLWNDSATPATPSSSDSASVEVGVKLSADVDGQIQGIRFFKGAQNIGAHTGSVWSTAGVLLGSVTFGNETASGWQTAYLTNPVDMVAGTTYIVSYRAPNGGYAVTPNGLGAAYDNAPLHTPVNAGVYTYGTGAPLNASSANYWVDVVYVATDAAPTVASTSPGASATNVNLATKPSATFSGTILNGSAQIGVRDADGNAVDGTTSYSTATRTITFAPTAPLNAGTVYTAKVTGAAGLSGNPMSPYSWSFTTAGAATCPCSLFESSAVPSTLDSGDGSALELGVSFSSTTVGYVTGVRFYKSAANVGTHTGSLWTSTGTRIATGTFTNETAYGWQTLTFAKPVQLAAGTTYVASYYAPQGHYSATGQFFSGSYANGPLAATANGNGLYKYTGGSSFPDTTSGAAANYWVDASFTPGVLPDTDPPSVTARTPIDGATSQSVTVAPSATFDEQVTAGSVAMTIKDAAGNAVAGSVGYDAGGKTATFTPNSPLARGTAYSATVSASDTSGNAMGAPVGWSFTTAKPDPTPGVCPCSVWTDATTPTTITANDYSSLEVGTAFTTDTDGSITGVRFYKGPQNTGTHTVSLWSAASGTVLANATATSESSTGWQTVSFATAIPVTAGTVYVVSYLAPNGQYSYTADALRAALDNAPLHTVAQGGRYVYGGGGTFPANTSSASYMVDPVFTTGTPVAPADTTAPTISNVNVATSGSTATVTWTTDESATSSVSYGTTASLGSTATGATGTSHSVTLTGLTSGQAYSYRVTSADTAGNSSSSPVTSGAPATFTAADTTAPTITGVTVSGSGSSRTITWSTDESSSTSVAFGTTTSVGQTATGSAGTSHSVTISGLADSTTYYYRVTSADAALNSSTSPAPPAAPASFATVDTTAPVVTGVAATGSATTATVTWTTNESATSVVQYGTTATALTSSANGATGTSHSVTLNGLTPNTRYYYRVVSADAAGNTTTSPATSAAAAQYVPTVQPIAKTTVADFTGGTGGYIADTVGGELMSTPTLGVEFSSGATGGTLPATLTSTTVATGGKTTLANNVATISGSRVASASTFSTGVTSAANATMAAGQSVGLASTASGSTSTRASFVMTAAGALTAVVNDGWSVNTTIQIPGTYTGAAHEYRVDWNSNTATFFVDGVQKASNAFQPTVQLRSVLLDPTSDATPLVVFWLRAGTYAASSTYVSPLIDAGAVVGWDTLTRDVTAPAGTTVTIRVRSGNTSTPGGSGWTSWTTVSATTNSITRSARYLQYQVISATSGTRFVSSATNGLQIAFHVL